MDKLTNQWLDAIAYDDYHEERFSRTERSERATELEKPIKRLEGLFADVLLRLQ